MKKFGQIIQIVLTRIKKLMLITKYKIHKAIGTRLSHYIKNLVITPWQMIQ